MQGVPCGCTGYSAFILQQRGSVRQWQVCLFFAGIFGQSAKKPRQGGTIWNALRAALRINSGIRFFIRDSEKPAGFSESPFHRRSRKGKRHLLQSKQKAPEGGCSPGKKGLMILYLFVVVGVLDLERNCHVALLGVALNNNTNVRPIAILADVNIRTGIDPL